MRYLSGFQNYPDHASASRDYYRSRCDVVLILMQDGTATLNWTENKPLYEGQVEYNPTSSGIIKRSWDYK